MDELKNQVLTEKSIRLLRQNQYTFDVNSKSTKTEIKDWIEQFFDVKVKDMNSHWLTNKRRKGKVSRFSLHRKRMIVTLRENYSIPLFVSE
uniref:ribosomal protein L23 n=1 Tax=Diplopterygium chinense TaxID=397680 RepID=UPI002028D1BA|nr:ribosomal protein L23 [Diplopterygium chinense]QYC93007.1 ribosomal protein L23 [Diplopterygium chinense]